MIADMTAEQIEQETQNYQNKLTQSGLKFHHKAKLATLILQWKDYEAENKESGVLSISERRTKQRKEWLALIRVRITNHNPSKKNITGEIFTCGNSVLGAVKKFVPYNCEAAEAYHLPKIMYETLKGRKFIQRGTKRVTIDGVKQTVPTMQEVKEFSFEVLEPLTETELKVLARKQAMAKGVEVE